MGCFTELFKRKQKKEASPQCEGRSIEGFLREWYGDCIPDEIISELAETFAKEFVKKIKIEIIKEEHYCLEFLCNLSPREMEERWKEVRVFLPRTTAGDDLMYNIVLSLRRENEQYLPRPSDKKGWWHYFAFA